MTPRETEVMKLADAGMSASAIAAELGQSAQQVWRIISYYNGDHTERYVRAMRRGSAELLAAIRAARRGVPFRAWEIGQ